MAFNAVQSLFVIKMNNKIKDMSLNLLYNCEHGLVLKLFTVIWENIININIMKYSDIIFT